MSLINNTRKILVVIGSRANYSSIKSVLREIKNNNALDLYIVCNTSAVSDIYGNVSKKIEEDGFKIYERHHNIVDGGDLGSMAKSTSLALLFLSNTIENLNPNFIITVGDRYETLATAIAAAYMNIPLVHTMGGEVSGTIDESIRHAITKLANIHFPASNDAKERILRMGEDERFVFNVGCPRIDLVKEIISQPNFTNEELIFLESNGVGDSISIESDFLLISQHPVTTEYDKQEAYIDETIEALKKFTMQKIILWPNSDAGTDIISQKYRKLREGKLISGARFYKNLPINIYIKLMKKTKCLIGNSSSGIREGAYIGTPVVNIGSRQNNRETGENVINADYNSHIIFSAIQEQIKRNKYPQSNIYGTGDAGYNIAKILSTITINSTQKSNSF